MYPTNEEESQKLIEVGDDLKAVGLFHLSRPLFLGLLISLEEQFKRMKWDELEGHYQNGVVRLSKSDEKKTGQERSLKFYDSRFYQQRMSI